MVRENMRSLDTVRFALLPRKMYGRNIYRGNSVEVQRSYSYLGNCMWLLDLVSARFLLYMSFGLIRHRESVLRFRRFKFIRPISSYDPVV